VRVLLTGARAPATLELARLCARAGHRVHVADTYQWHICRGSRLIAGVHRLPSPRRAGLDAYATALNRLIDEAQIDCLLPTCEEIFHVARIRERVHTAVRCEALNVLATLHDKLAFTHATHAAGLRAPRTYQLHAARGADIADAPAGTYAVKRRFSRFATAVRTWSSHEPPPLAVHEAATEWIAQEWLDGTPLCSWSVAVKGELRAHVTYTVDATAGKHGAAIAFRSVRHAATRDWVAQFVRHHALSGQFAFDFIEQDAGVLALECNPRLTSGIHCFRGMPDVVTSLLAPDSARGADVLEPQGGLAFRSRLAMLTYGAQHGRGESLLHAPDDPWPRRLQLVSWLHLLARAGLAGVDPRVLSTADIEWNGE
jgi:predicted ATP-grasp superfamily ATP-dependent carboligase